MTENTAPVASPAAAPAAPAPSQDVDISKQTLVVLVILSCAISVIGVVTMIYQFSNLHAAPVMQNSGPAVAQTSFTLLPNGHGGVKPGTEATPGTPGTGMVALTIKKP